MRAYDQVHGQKLGSGKDGVSYFISFQIALVERNQ